MNVLLICDEYPPGKTGGIGTAVRLQARQLVKLGHRVWVSGLYPWAYGQQNEEEDQGVKVVRHRYGLKTANEGFLYKLFKKLPAIIRKYWNGKSAFDRYINSIHHLVEHEKIDVIEIPDWSSFTMHIGFTVQWPAFKAPLVVKAHGCYTKICHDLGVKVPPRARLTDSLLYDRADAICAASRDTAETNRKLFAITKNISVLYNGVEMPAYPANSVREDFTAVFMGSLTVQKGVYQLMKAWNSVHAKWPGAKLEVYGKGKTEPLENLLDASVRESVYFGGFVNRDTLLNKLSTAGLAVLPSYTETFGLVAVEAMSHGCPVIYTKRACGPEIITEGEDGLLVEPDNIEDIANCISRLFESKALRQRLSENGRRTVASRFDIAVLSHELEKYYEQVIERFKSQSC